MIRFHRIIFNKVYSQLTGATRTTTKRCSKFDGVWSKRKSTRSRLRLRWSHIIVTTTDRSLANTTSNSASRGGSHADAPLPVILLQPNGGPLTGNRLTFQQDEHSGPKQVLFFHGHGWPRQHGGDLVVVLLAN